MRGRCDSGSHLTKSTTCGDQKPKSPGIVGCDPGSHRGDSESQGGVIQDHSDCDPGSHKSLKEEPSKEETKDLKTPPTPKSPTLQDPSSGHASERGEKNPADGTRDNPKEAERRSTKGDGSHSRQNTSSGEIPLPDWLHPEDWNDYREHRSSIKCPLTPLAEKKALGELERLRSSGNDPARVISQSIVNGWKGLFPVQSSKDSQSGRQRPQTFDEIRTENNKKAVNEFLRKRGEPSLFQEKGEINVIDL